MNKKSIPVVINGREIEVDDKTLNEKELIALAFENPPTGKYVCFTIIYRLPRGNKPAETLDPGEELRVKKGMIINVTATDKS